MVSLASGAVQVLLNAPATPPARSCEIVPICFGGGCTNFRTPPSTATPTLASICISWFRFSLFYSPSPLSLTKIKPQPIFTVTRIWRACNCNYASSISSLRFLHSAQNQTTTRSSSSSSPPFSGRRRRFCDPD